MPFARPLAAAAAAALALSTLSGCSAAKHAAAGAAAAPMVSVADAMSLTTKATQRYTSAHVRLNESGDADGNYFSLAISGAMGWKPASMDLAMSIDDMDNGSTDLRMQLSGSTMWVNAGGVAIGKTGKHWLKVDFATMGAEGKMLAEQLNKADGNDPAAQVKLFTSASGITRIGTESMNGVRVTHYGGTVSLSQLDALRDTRFSSLLDVTERYGAKSLYVDLWVDARNLPVRVTESAPRTPKLDFQVEIDYTGYSTAPLTITPPPAADTYTPTS